MTRLPLRRRAAIELGALTGATVLFLVLLPSRPISMNMALALAALVMVGISARETRERFWARSGDRWAIRLRRSGALVLGLSGPVVLAFGVYAAVEVEPRSASALATRLLGPAFVETLAVFIPWALVQQTLFQFYLLGRLRALLTGISPLVPVVLTGLGYGAVHLPDWELTLLTAPAGIVWSYAYQRDRVLLPGALSHALLGTTYFVWVRGRALPIPWISIS